MAGMVGIQQQIHDTGAMAGCDVSKFKPGTFNRQVGGNGKDAKIEDSCTYQFINVVE